MLSPRIMSMPDPPAIADPLEPFYEAVKRYTGLSRATAKRLAAAGEVRTVSLGGRTLVRQSELRRLIDNAEARTLTLKKEPNQMNSITAAPVLCGRCNREQDGPPAALDKSHEEAA